MLEYLVLYHSESGNTKKIAATIFSHLPGTSKDLIDITTDKTIFGTCGMGNSPAYYSSIEHSVSVWIESDNEYLGAFICQGKMPQKVRQKYESIRTARNALQISLCLRNFDEALTHPDSLDLEHSKVFTEKTLKKIQAED